ncbi:hypothetical protein [Flavilitoribacter nigricans]|uniref:Uncharacterized protein n=1 Tax=Flavilitoribacter nigricans (strain ATCC 23147 / DSM 23189 / NBRC 102662 / NCIMB 1420 / SS-2) TaxID=1122177 RepID=A0A2D0NGV2_FLAN2|nr:hypothetical protein [Flavilitoribacter nigricans]PHN07722.1 hypothetical protein CRP01_05905 [Flavilitoribacter nigricans DSM 23189 = NBRC 102662]
MEYLGLFVELLLLLAGVYLYLFAIGRLKFKDEATRQKAEQFRAQNGTWLRLAALALTAIMVINIFIHISQLTAG